MIIFARVITNVSFKPGDVLLQKNLNVNQIFHLLDKHYSDVTLGDIDFI